MYLFLKVVEQNSSLVSHTNDLDLATWDVIFLKPSS
jgi:hypothetical protein